MVRQCRTVLAGHLDAYARLSLQTCLGAKAVAFLESLPAGAEVSLSAQFAKANARKILASVTERDVAGGVAKTRERLDKHFAGMRGAR